MEAGSDTGLGPRSNRRAMEWSLMCVCDLSLCNGTLACGAVAAVCSMHVVKPGSAQGQGSAANMGRAVLHVKVCYPSTLGRMPARLLHFLPLLRVSPNRNRIVCIGSNQCELHLRDLAGPLAGPQFPKNCEPNFMILYKIL